jgi:urease accessory protein UreE
MAQFWREDQLVQTQKNKELKRRAHDLGNQHASYGPRHGSTQEFNLLQVSPNWFLGI